MDKIFEILGIECLDESKQEELKETLKTVIDVKATELAEGKVEKLLEAAKETLKEEYEVKFDEYRDGLTSKFSNFVDNVLDEEMVIPENVMKWAKQGELYHELIEQFKTRLAIDEGMISDEVRGMLREAKDEIESLRAKVDEARGANLDLEQDASEMAAQLYIREKCDGLTASQKKHVISLLGDEIIKENIDKKFSIIVNTMGIISESEDGDEDDENGDEDKDEVFEMSCGSCGNKETVKEEMEEMECPECGKAMKPTKKVEEGHSEVIDKKKAPLNENKSTPWETYKSVWLESIKGSK
jgi:inactivated superfamily I helicase/DNA-directed RNA polymerase subunit RPC12/RpoP